MNATTANKIAKTLTPAVNVVLVARAEAELVKEEVDAIKARHLAADVYLDEMTGERVTEPKYDWTIEDDAWKVYRAKVEADVRAAGYDVPEDHCPAAMAENKLTEAENMLIELARVTLPDCEHVTNAALLRGKHKDGKMVTDGLTFRREWLDMLIKAAVNAPGYKTPLAA